MKKKQEIILGYLEGKSQRDLAKETGKNRRTVSAYIVEYEEAKRKLLESGELKDSRELIDKIVEKPKYKVPNRPKRKATDDMVNKIEEYLRENEHKRCLGQGKQQKKWIDIHEALIKAGYDISYGTVRNIINRLAFRQKEAFIKSEYALGDVCEFDWGEVKIFIAGELKVLQMAVFTNAKGNYRYAICFVKQDTVSFQQAHAIFFSYIDGVYQTMVYDNMRIVIKRFVGSTEKEPTESLLKLSIYYGFKFRFCNINAGNEKGHVERSVDFIRRKAFAFSDKFESIADTNEYLLQVCDELNHRPQKLNDQQSACDILEKERDYLLPGMPRFDAAKICEPRVDKYSTINVDTCHYSVPDRYVGRTVFTKIYSDEIICFDDGKKIAEHVKKYGFNEWSIKIEHYLETLKKKPGALASSTALLQANPQLQNIYHEYYIKREREFIELLQFMKEKSFEKIAAAIRILQKVSPFDITTEKIKTICNRTAIFIPKIDTESEIVIQSKAMLKQFKNLIPASTQEFEKEAAII